MLIWIFLLISITIASNNYDKFILFYGETQTGKSSMINAIFKQNVAKSGKGRGTSITEYPTVYSKSFRKDEQYGIPQDFTLNMMDTPGNLDTRRLYTDADILNNIIFALSQVNNIQQIDVIFISESLAGDSLQLTRNLEKIREIFGESVMKSIVLLGTKPELGINNNGGERDEEAQDLCKHFKIKYMKYESRKDYHHLGQLKAIMDILFRSDIKPYQMKQVGIVREKIEKRSQELMKQTPKQEKIIQVEKQVIKYKDVQKTETYWDRVWGEVGRGGRRYGVFGPRKRIDGWIPVQKTRTITVKEPYEVKEMLNEKVEVDHDPEKFRQLARDEHKKALKLNIEFKKEL